MVREVARQRDCSGNHHKVCGLLYNNIISDNNIYIARGPASCSQVLYMTIIPENKSHIIKRGFKQMCLKTFLFFKAPIDLEFVIDPDRAFHRLTGAKLLPAT